MTNARNPVDPQNKISHPVHSQDGKGRYRVWLNLLTPSCIGRATGEDQEVGKEGQLYLMLHSHHQNDSSIKKGSGESHFNVSLIVRSNVTRVSTNHDL